MRRRAFLLGAPLVVAGCAGGQSVWAPDSAVDAAMFLGTGPKALTLYTMRNTGSGNGAHSSILIDASQRVLFDPAGSFANTRIPERNDVLFGMSPQIEDYYVSYHARETYYVEGQHIVVSAAVAEQALQLALAYGPVGQGRCSRATSAILGQLPGFESINSTLFPNALRDKFAKIAGVELTEYRETDSDDKSVAAAQINAALKSGQ
ncbi:MAG: hypothetical protein ACI82I_000208 [Gammaproteobacteria bacterium]|jgi:hypothetical protein